MANFNTNENATEIMSYTERGVRIGLGLAVLIGTLHFSVNGGDAYPLTKFFATIVVLTGIAGWDPFYAVFRKTMSRLTNMEAMTFSSGNIGVQDRALRIGMGLTVLIFSLQGPMGSMESYTLIKMFATTAVLTGIAGWDPIYAAFRNTVSKLSKIRVHRNLAFLSYR